MTTSKRLAAFRADHAPSLELEANELTLVQPVEDDEDDENSCSEKKDKDMTTQNTDEMVAKAVADATAAANARFSAVLASEHYAGRETLAQTLLGNDKLTAEEINTALAAAPALTVAAEPITTPAAADEAARNEMKAAITGTGNSNIDAGSTPAPSTTNSSASVWDQASKINNF